MRARRSLIINLAVVTVLVIVAAAVAITLAGRLGDEGNLSRRQQTLDGLIYESRTTTAVWRSATQTAFYVRATLDATTIAPASPDAASLDGALPDSASDLGPPVFSSATPESTPPAATPSQAAPPPVSTSGP